MPAWRMRYSNCEPAWESLSRAVAMKITGHRTDSVFRRYAIVDLEQKREALARTEQYLAVNAERKVVAMKGK
jgi:hypothetical protein